MVRLHCLDTTTIACVTSTPMQETCLMPQHPDLRPTSPLPKHLPGEPAFPERIERMIALIRKHQALLCAYDIGTMEIHFRGASVKPTITCSPEG
jgi:hypothetical protein